MHPKMEHPISQEVLHNSRSRSITDGAGKDSFVIVGFFLSKSP
jgi:hypothetical protein